MPVRIQRRRTAGYRMPEGAVYVGRPTRWGNPFKVGDACTESVYVSALIDGVPLARSGVVEDAAHAVTLFQFWLFVKVPFTAAELQAGLEGRDLACWCRVGQPCHADVLLEIANQPGGTA